MINNIRYRVRSIDATGTLLTADCGDSRDEAVMIAARCVHIGRTKVIIERITTELVYSHDI